MVNSQESIIKVWRSIRSDCIGTPGWQIKRGAYLLLGVFVISPSLRLSPTRGERVILLALPHPLIPRFTSGQALSVDREGEIPLILKSHCECKRSNLRVVVLFPALRSPRRPVGLPRDDNKSFPRRQIASWPREDSFKGRLKDGDCIIRGSRLWGQEKTRREKFLEEMD